MVRSSHPPPPNVKEDTFFNDNCAIAWGGGTNTEKTITWDKTRCRFKLFTPYPEDMYLSLVHASPLAPLAHIPVPKARLSS
jgi:hypothetical protein